MKCPNSGKEMKRVYERRVWKFRGEEFEYIHTAWRCEDTGEQFTTDESDNSGFLQATNQYRAKYGIPFTDEIAATRNRYGISAAKMALILGIGINQYRLYEQGEVPSVSNGRMIRSVMNPKVMLDMLESSRNELTEQEYSKFSAKLRSIIADDIDYKLVQHEIGRVFCVPRGAENGFAETSLVRLKNIMINILARCDNVWLTKMNKLLFYVDFLSYRERGCAMTGLTYRAIDFGPVPEQWDKVYSEFPEIVQELHQSSGYVGSMLRANATADSGVLTEQEMKVIDTVCNALGNKSSKDLSQISHQEDAWLNNQAGHKRIPFCEAFSIKAF